MTVAPAREVAARNGVPPPADPAAYRKHSAYLTAAKRRQDAYKARLEILEDQRWNCEMEITTLEAQHRAISSLPPDLAPEDSQVKGVTDELRRQRIMLVSFDAAIEAIRGLTVPEQEKPAKPGAKGVAPDKETD